MRSNMLELYKKLDLNNQINELSLLLIKIDQLLNNLLIQKDIPLQSQAKNYDLNINNDMSEKDVNKDNENALKLFEQAKIDAEVSYINEIKKIIETKTKEDPNIKKI